MAIKWKVTELFHLKILHSSLIKFGRWQPNHIRLESSKQFQRTFILKGIKFCAIASADLCSKYLIINNTNFKSIFNMRDIFRRERDSWKNDSVAMGEIHSFIVMEVLLRSHWRNVTWKQSSQNSAAKSGEKSIENCQELHISRREKIWRKDGSKYNDVTIELKWVIYIRTRVSPKDSEWFDWILMVKCALNSIRNHKVIIESWLGARQDQKQPARWSESSEMVLWMDTNSDLLNNTQTAEGWSVT